MAGMAEMLGFRRRDGEEVASEFRSALPFYPLVKTYSPALIIPIKGNIIPGFDGYCVARDVE
jgi:hypothetical protein